MSTLAVPSAIDFLEVERVVTLNGVDYKGATTASTLNGTLTLDADSECLQYVTGTATGFSVVLPSALTLKYNTNYVFVNTTPNTIDIKNGSRTVLFTLSQNSFGYLYLRTNLTVAGVWDYWQVLASSTASGVINYNLISSTAFTTSVRTPTYAIITGFSLTPQAGTYAIWYNASVYYTTTPKPHYWSIYKNGSAITDSKRQQDTAHSNQTMVDATMTIASFNGTDVCAVYVSCADTGSLTVNARSLLMVRLGS